MRKWFFGTRLFVASNAAASGSVFAVNNRIFLAKSCPDEYLWCQMNDLADQGGDFNGDSPPELYFHDFLV